MYDEDSELQKEQDQLERNRTYEEASEDDCPKCGHRMSYYPREEYVHQFNRSGYYHTVHMYSCHKCGHKEISE